MSAEVQGKTVTGEQLLTLLQQLTPADLKKPVMLCDPETADLLPVTLVRQVSDEDNLWLEDAEHAEEGQVVFFGPGHGD